MTTNMGIITALIENQCTNAVQRQQVPKLADVPFRSQGTVGGEAYGGKLVIT